MKWFGCRMMAYGFLIGTAGVKLLSGRTAKKAYTHVTAAALRCYEDAAQTYETLKENCGDILADAKNINETRAAAEEVVEDVETSETAE